MQNEIEYLEDLIKDKKAQIAYNDNCIIRGETPTFYMKWSKEIKLEIDSFEMNVANKKSLFHSLG